MVEDRAGRRPINVKRAMALLNAGLTYPAIGVVLAREEGRSMPYAGRSVWGAIRRVDLSKPKKETAHG